MTAQDNEEFKEAQELKKLEQDIRKAIEKSIEFDAKKVKNTYLNDDSNSIKMDPQDTADPGLKEFTELLKISNNQSNLTNNSAEDLTTAQQGLFDDLKAEFLAAKEKKLTPKEATELTGIAIGKTIMILASTAARLIGDGLIVTGKLLNFSSLGLMNTIVPGGRKAEGNEIIQSGKESGMRNWGSVHIDPRSENPNVAGWLKSYGNLNVIERLGYGLANAGVLGQDTALSDWKNPLNTPGIKAEAKGMHKAKKRSIEL